MNSWYRVPPTRRNVLEPSRSEVTQPSGVCNSPSNTNTRSCCAYDTASKTEDDSQCEPVLTGIAAQLFAAAIVDAQFAAQRIAGIVQNDVIGGKAPD